MYTWDYLYCIYIEGKIQYQSGHTYSLNSMSLFGFYLKDTSYLKVMMNCCFSLLGLVEVFTVSQHNTTHLKRNKEGMKFLQFIFDKAHLLTEKHSK